MDRQRACLPGAPALGFSRGGAEKKGRAQRRGRDTVSRRRGKYHIGAGNSLERCSISGDELPLSLFRMKCAFRAVDLFFDPAMCAQALPIVTLISFVG